MTALLFQNSVGAGADGWSGWAQLRERMDQWALLESRTFENGNREFGLVKDRRPGELRALFWFYRGLSEEEISAAEVAIGRPIPACIRSFYRCSNGARLFNQVSIGGYVETLSRDPAPGCGQPSSLEDQNGYARPPGLSNSDFVFGSIIGNNVVGQLVISGTSVRLVHAQDGSDVAVEWPDFETFLFSEFDRLSVLYDARGCFDGDWLSSLPSQARHWESA